MPRFTLRGITFPLLADQGSATIKAYRLVPDSGLGLDRPVTTADTAHVTVRAWAGDERSPRDAMYQWWST